MLNTSNHTSTSNPTNTSNQKSTLLTCHCKFESWRCLMWAFEVILSTLNPRQQEHFSA